MTCTIQRQEWFVASLLASVLLSCLVSPSPAAADTERPAVLAVVDGRTITGQDVDASIHAKLQPLQQQIYALRKSALENLITRALLEAEAKRKAISEEQLRKDLTAGEVSVDAADIDRAYAENESAFGSMSADEIRERLRLDLESSSRMRKYREELGRLRDRASVRIFLEEPRVPSVAIAAGGPFRGAADARVTITEYSDFECPYCKTAAAGLRQLLDRRGKDVKLVFKHLPMQGHRQAFPAARAAVCAAEQGSFWPFHDALFGDGQIDATALDRIATTVGLDRPKYEACMSSPRSQARVLDDANEAKRLGINGTPAFVINGRVRHGSMTFEQLQKIVDDELNAQTTESSLSSR